MVGSMVGARGWVKLLVHHLFLRVRPSFSECIFIFRIERDEMKSRLFKRKTDVVKLDINMSITSMYLRYTVVSNIKTHRRLSIALRLQRVEV